MTPHESPRPLVVAIGVSADGLAALQAVVGPLERVFPAAILIVRHVAPTAPGLGAKILGRATRIPVKEAMAGERLQPGVIYVAPPDLHLSVVDGALGLDRGPKVRFARPSIDVLFASVARVCGARSIGVLLSGGGTDGATGLAAIRKAGGLTIVQDPSETTAPWMPMAAMAMDGHRVVPLAEIAGVLNAAVTGTRPAQSDPDSR